MNTFDDPSVTVEPQPVASPARVACLPPTVTFELPEVMALPAGHGACRLWSPALRQGSGLRRGHSGS